MDPRISEHAEQLVEYSTEVQDGDLVTIVGDETADDLLVALHEAIGRRGGEPVVVNGVINIAGGFSDHRGRAHMLAADGEFHTPEHLLRLLEASDVILFIRCDSNLSALGDVPEGILQARSQTFEPVMEEIMAGTERLNGTQHPTKAWAQAAEMSLDEYRDFAYEAMLRDWAAIREEQETLSERLEAAETVRITTDETDLTMSVEGSMAVNDDGKKNLPGGEVFTAPVVDSVDGEVVFDLPVIVQGAEIEDARLVFEEGEVVEADAKTNEDVLAGLLETDPGARRLGELGIGTNGQIDRFTRNILFDEKLAGTVHLALGRAYPMSVGEDNEVNESGIHVDMLVDMADGTLEFDGEPVLVDGEFTFEEEHLTPSPD